MNILFINKDKVLPNNGGTERATYNVGRTLKNNYGHKIFNMYMYDNKEEIKEELFTNIYKFERSNLKKEIDLYVTKYNIDVIIIQGYFDLVYDVYYGVKDKNIRILFAHHFEPGFETKLLKFRDYFIRMQSSVGFSKIKNIIHCGLYPIYKVKYDLELHKLYKKAYQYSDKIILLSGSYIQKFMLFGRISDDSKFKIIPNILSFEEKYSSNLIEKKQKKILVVSRMDEISKRISYIIRIWKDCTNNYIFNDWSLDIVGDGPDLEYYKKITIENKIPRITFHGRKNPVNYYINSSIFLMTSISEGWGLTLTEAQHFGVVPIAMDTYLSLRDIITDNVDGYIVENNNFTKYINTMAYLVSNDNKRIEIATNCINNVNRFSSKNIGEKWEQLIKL